MEAKNELLARLSMGNMAELEKKVASLGQMTQNKRAARRFARNKGTIQDLLKGIRERPKFTKMVEYSVQCLKNLAVDEVSVEEMIDEGVLDVLNDVLKVNPYNEAIQQQVNAALIAFCKNEYLAKMVAERFGMNGLVFSLKKHVETDTISSTSMPLRR